MNVDVDITDKSGEVLEALKAACNQALEACGLKAEGYAQGLVKVVTGNLRNSITHQVNDGESVEIGSAVEYAPYVCMGTYKMEAKPFLKPAVADHVSEYQEIIQGALQSGE